jgi:MFS family permease
VVVVSTALPQLRLHLGASLSDLEWTINAYNLAFASLMLTGAALGDRFGRRILIARAGVGYTALVPAFIVAGIGISFVFPTLANAADARPMRGGGSPVPSGSSA